MAQAVASIDLPVPAGQVWALIGGFGSLPDWLPFIPRSELGEGGRVRRLTTPDGATIVERLMAFDHSGRSYSYAILESPFPVTDYLSTLRVKDVEKGDGARVECGRVRRLTTPDGATIVERLMAFDHSGRSYSYAILESPFPVTDYLSTLRVKDVEKGDGARVEWWGRFTPVGVSDDEASSQFRGIYEDGLKALAGRLAPKT